MKIFHHNDIDGHAAAALIYNVLDTDKQAEFIECNYSFPLMPVIETIQSGEKIFIVDYSFTPDTYHELHSIIKKVGTANVTWIDHHKSSMELQKMYPELTTIAGIRQTDISGAALTAMFIHSLTYSEIPEILKYISDYDCWIKSMPDTDAIYYGILSKDWKYTSCLWKEVLTENYNLTNLKHQGEAVLSYLHHDNLMNRNKWAFETRLADYPCLAINRKVTSEIFGKDLTQYPIYCVFQFDGEKWRYSIYSRTVDCSLIAAEFGGGGHQGAAGFHLPYCLFDKSA